jgi:hypothetical protein
LTPTGLTGTLNAAILTHGNMSIAQIAKNILGHTERLFGSKPAKNELLVICMHSTPADRLDDFKNIVSFLDNQFVYLPAQEVGNFFSSQYHQGPYYTLTFDDGLLNNFRTAEWLASIGKTATYFVVPDFIESNDQSSYYQTHIRPIVNRTIDHEKEDVTAMQWSQLKTLRRLGHVIGGHTASHRLHKNMNEEQVKYEIIDSKVRIEVALGETIDVFASPNNTLVSVNNECAAMINSTYKLHYITVPGTLTEAKNPQIIFRRNIEVHWKIGAIQYALGSWDLRRWEEDRIQILSLLRSRSVI